MRNIAKWKFNGDPAAEMAQRVTAFLQEEKRARLSAAVTATQTTQAAFTRRRPSAPARRGRSGESLQRNLRWKATDEGVRFDLQHADSKSPHWIIQEIGTGQSATLQQGGSSNPKGRAKKGANYIKTVKSQRGRAISPGLAWGTGPGGKFSAPGSAVGQQLFLRSSLKLAGGDPNARSPYSPYRDTMRITKEIKGQHMVRQGSKTGFREYETSVYAAARKAFGGRPFKP